VAERPEIAHMLQLFTVFSLVFPITGASAHFFACLSLKSAHKSGFCSFLVAERPEIAHMLQLFTVFVLVFPITGASAHFSPA